MGGVVIMLGILVGLLILFFFLLGSYQVVVKKQESVRDRLDQYVQAHEDGAPSLGPAKPSAMEGAAKLAKKRDFWENIGAILTPEGMSKSIGLKLSAAGIPLRANEFMAGVFFLSVVPLVVICFLMKRIFLGLIVSAILAYLPFFWISWKRKSRCKKFASQLLDTLVLMSNSLKAGYSFLQAVELLTREAPSPSREEFKRVVRENSLGAPVEKSLEAMAERLQSEDFDLLVTVIGVQKEVGGNLSEIFDQIASTIRIRQQIKGQIMTLTAQGRMSGYVISGLPFFLGGAIFVINPKYFVDDFMFNQIGNFKGWYLLVGCLFMELIGFMIILKITDIDV